MNELKSWDELSRKEQLEGIYWDMYKEAHGFRPRHIRLDLCTEAELEADLDRLQVIIADNELLRKESEFRAEVDFEMRVQNLLTTGAKDRAMALRWIHEAEGSNGDDEFLCYLVGLPYRYLAVDKAAV
jgi:hypothetical protein